ncbi:Virulence promoting factor [Kosakonia sacchari]|uniref:Uncharacterized protein YqgB n=2 Tax=Kosakonia sacchari TaxID=1158459 RepID=A0A1G4Y0Q4_9ENTR|nr:Virulence promoting factor [Kosakonia sacchari]
MFYNDMNKKPVAQSVLQHISLKSQTVYGLLSLCVTAIVVNYFIRMHFRAVAFGRRDVHRVYTFIY